MALIGLRYIVIAPLKEKTTYGTGFVLGKAIKADLNVTTANAELHADDVLAESDNSFVSGTLSVGVDDIAEEHKNIILGHEENDGETTANVDDAAIEVGLGFYGVKMKNGKRKYRAIWLRKGKFAEPSESFKTKEGSTTFTTPELTYTFGADDDGNWKNEKTFDTPEEAVKYLNAKANIR